MIRMATAGRGTPAGPTPRRDGLRTGAPGLVVACCVALGTPGCADWSLFKQGSSVVEPVEVVEVFEQAPLPQVDVLWVIDDTASMDDELAALSDAFGAFIDGLEALDLSWQTGVITADGTGDAAGVLQGNPWVIHPDLDDPASAFRTAVDVGADGSGTESGLGAAWLALSSPLVDDDNRGFRRDGASLHVVVVSDSDDESAHILGDDPAGAFLDFLDDQALEHGTDAVLSAVVGPVPDGCGSAQPAQVYTQVAELSGGAVASICEADFSAVTAAIAEASISWPQSFLLQAEPAEGTLSARIDGNRMADDRFEVDAEARRITFDTPPPPGAIIEVTYELAEEQ